MRPDAACSSRFVRCPRVIDLLLPSTDAGVAFQFAAVFIVGSAAIVVTRSNRDLRLLAIGVTILAVALMTLRAVH